MAQTLTHGMTLSSFFLVDYNQTLDLNIPAIVNAGSNLGTTTSVTPITTVGAGVITAAAMISSNILRTGPTSAYTDTTDTAANIVAAIPNVQVGHGIEFTIANEVAYLETIAAGSGVTLAGTTNNSASASRNYVLKVTSLTPAAVTITGISSGGL